MFKHIFIYNLKTILRSREAVFWTFLFPIVLSTFFYFAFGNLSSVDSFDVVDIAVTENEELADDSAFYSALASVSDIDGVYGNDDIFHVVTVSDDEADSLLESGEISAYITYDDEIQLVVAGSGLNQTITKMFLDKYLQYSSLVENILTETPQAISEGLYESIYQSDEYILQEEASDSAEANTTVIYFYALLAMTCLMGSTTAVEEIIKLQANMSPRAARINAAPTPKFKLFLYNISATVLFQSIVILAVLVYLIFVLGIDFGDRVWYILLTCVVGCITGVFFGTTVSVGFKTSGIKYGITIGGSLFSCFLAGLMVVDMKYWIQENLPVVGYISPANLITDAFYNLYYYDDLSRYFLNLGLLCVLSAVFCTVTCLVMRRKNYASI